MSGFAGAELLATLPWTAGAVLIVLVLTFAVARVVGRHSVIDVAWGLMFCAVAVTAFLCSAGDGDNARRWLLLSLTVVWGARLAVHICRRSRGKPEDPRYEQLLVSCAINSCDKSAE